MGTRYRYLGRSWPGLPERHIEADEAHRFGDTIRQAAQAGAFIPELVPDAPAPVQAPAPTPKPRAPRKASAKKASKPQR